MFSATMRLAARQISEPEKCPAMAGQTVQEPMPAALEPGHTNIH